MHFAFTDLSIELALEIVRLASVPVIVSDETTFIGCSTGKSTKTSYYSTALALASVSYAIRQVTMPYLLHTVVLHSTSNVHAFIDALRLQEEYSQCNSRLRLEYKTLVRRLWSTECWDGVVDDIAHSGTDYTVLYPILSGLESLGLNFRSLSLLYNGLAHASLNFAQEWKCRHVTLAGPMVRWKPLTSTPEGLAFLGQITHLTLWIPEHTTFSGFPPPFSEGLVPQWVQTAPFAYMPNLTHFACPLVLRDASYKFSQMVVYRVPPDCHDPALLRRWVLGGEPLVHGVVVQADVPRANKNSFTYGDYFDDSSWERAYMQSRNESVWKEAEELLSYKR